MLSIVLTILCLGALLMTFSSQFKVRKLINDNISVNKSNLEFRTDFIKMNKSIETLTNDTRELKEQNVRLIDLSEKLEFECSILTNRVTYLEEENKKIKTVLENYNLMAPSFEIKKPFLMKLVK